MVLSVVAFAGFAPTFYLRPGASPDLSPLLLVHGLCFTTWLIAADTVTCPQAVRVVEATPVLHRRPARAGGQPPPRSTETT